MLDSSSQGVMTGSLSRSIGGMLSRFRFGAIQWLVLCGVATSGVVLSTLRQAADADYRIIVLRDCCGDLDAEVHACLMNKVFPRQATVLPSVDFTSALQDA